MKGNTHYVSVFVVAFSFPNRFNVHVCVGILLSQTISFFPLFVQGLYVPFRPFSLLCGTDVQIDICVAEESNASTHSSKHCQQPATARFRVLADDGKPCMVPFILLLMQTTQSNVYKSMFLGRKGHNCEIITHLLSPMVVLSPNCSIFF